MTHIAFIGLGAMGLPMALNILKGGFPVVGYDIAAAPAKALAEAGGRVAASAAEAARGADAVITMLPEGRMVEAVLLGEGAVAEAMPPEALVIDMSTILPAEADAIRDRLGARGIAMIDAPVGRTASEAVTGTLLVMVGADAALLSRARPVLETMGDTIVHCGPAGAGIRMKLVNNYMTVVSNVVTAEALTLAGHCGIDTETALAVMRGTAAGRGHMNTTYPDKVLKGDLTPGFMVALAMKDLKLGLATGEAAGVRLTTGAAALGVYDHAVATGHGRKDWTAMLDIVPTLK